MRLFYTSPVVRRSSKSFPQQKLFRAYPRTEQMPTSCVEQDMDVLCSSHGGGYAMQLVRSVCADAGEDVAAVGVTLAQVSA